MTWRLKQHLKLRRTSLVPLHHAFDVSFSGIGELILSAGHHNLLATLRVLRIEKRKLKIDIYKKPI